jgi:hypothetical protein
MANASRPYKCQHSIGDVPWLVPHYVGFIFPSTDLSIDYLADTSVVPYINDEFSYFFETAFDVTDENFSSCALDRPAGSNGDGLMMIVNHFLDVEILPGVLVPDDALDTRTNAPTGAGSIGAQADLCKQTWGRKPNLILLDRFNRGEYS